MLDHLKKLLDAFPNPAELSFIGFDASGKPIETRQASLMQKVLVSDVIEARKDFDAALLAIDICKRIGEKILEETENKVNGTR